MYDDGAVVPVEAKISPSAGSSVEPLSQHRIVRPLECLKADALDSEPLDTCSGAFLQPDVTPCFEAHCVAQSSVGQLANEEKTIEVLHLSIYWVTDAEQRNALGLHGEVQQILASAGLHQSGRYGS